MKYLLWCHSNIKASGHEVYGGILEWGILSLFACRIWNSLLTIGGNEHFFQNLTWNTEFSVLRR